VTLFFYSPATIFLPSHTSYLHHHARRAADHRLHWCSPTTPMLILLPLQLRRHQSSITLDESALLRPEPTTEPPLIDSRSWPKQSRNRAPSRGYGGLWLCSSRRNNSSPSCQVIRKHSSSGRRRTVVTGCPQCLSTMFRALFLYRRYVAHLSYCSLSFQLQNNPNEPKPSRSLTHVFTCQTRVFMIDFDRLRFLEAMSFFCCCWL
jgi:hypothetical protein